MVGEVVAKKLVEASKAIEAAMIAAIGAGVDSSSTCLSPGRFWLHLEHRLPPGEWHYTVADGVPLELQEKVLTDTLEMVRKKLGGTAPPPTGAEG